MKKELATQDNLFLALQKRGMTDEKIAEKLEELLDWTEIKVDKNGNSYETKDGGLRLKAIELWLKIKNPKQGNKNNHLHLGGEALDRLLGKNSAGKKQGIK